MSLSRARKVWSIQEALSLQREYELLCLTPEEMAERHRRSVSAIISRLESEDYYTPDVLLPPSPVVVISSSTNTENDGLADRMKTVETNLNEVREAVAQMMHLLSQVSG